MLAVGALSIAGFGYAVKSAADFEQQLSRFGAASNASASDMEKLRQKALQLGQDSAYGATEVVKAFAELAYAGATTTEIVSGLGDAVVYLAAAGEIPLADASTTLINTMRQFNIPATQAVGIADELARAANASTITIEDLNTSLRYVGPVAAAAGISFQSTAEALAVMGNEGIRGSTAGTSLRGILVGITKPSQQAAAKMQELGIITKDGANQFFTATGELKSFKDIAQILQDTTRGLTKEQKLNAFGVIFQRRAMATAAVLAKEGAAGFDKLTASQQYNTTAQEIMKKKLDNLKGSFKILKASLETAAITLGELFTPYLKAAADAIKEMVDWFTRLPAPVKQVVGLILVLGGGFLILGGAMAKIASSALKAYKAFKDLAAGLQLITAAEGEADAAFAVSPLGWVVIAVLLLAAAVWFLWTRWDTVWKLISDNPYIAAVLALIFPFIAILIAVVGAVKYLYDNWSTIWPAMKAIAKSVLDWFKQAWHDVETWVGDAIQNVISFVVRLYEEITKWISEAVGNVEGFFSRLPTVIINALTEAGTAILNFVTQIPGWFLYALGFTLGFVVGFAVELVAKFLELEQNIVSGFLDFVTNFLSTVNSWGVEFLTTVFNFITQLPGMLFDNFMAGLTILTNFVIGMVNGAISMGLGVLNAIITFFPQIPGIVFNALIGALIAVLNFGGQMVNSMISTGIGVVNAAVSFFSQVPGDIAGILGGIPGTVLGIGGDIINGLIHGVESGANHLKHLVSDLAGSIIDGFKSALDIFSPSKVMAGIGTNVVQGLVQGMEKSAPLIQGPISSITDALQNIQTTALTTGMLAGATGPSPYNTPYLPGQSTIGGNVDNSKQAVVNQDITIQALNPDELAAKLTAERDWALRTAKVG